MSTIHTMTASEAIAHATQAADAMVKAIRKINQHYPTAFDEDGNPLKEAPPPDYEDLRRRCVEIRMADLAQRYVIIPDVV